MSTDRTLTENGWKTVLQKSKVKDNGLQRALATYEKLDETKLPERLRAIAAVTQLATSLQRNKDVAALKDVDKYLDEILAAARSVPAEIKSAQAEAVKAAAAAKKQEQQAAQEAAAAEEAEDGEDEDETGDAYTKLTTALKTIRTAKKPYYFLVCDAKPYGLVLSKKDIRKNMEARKELAKVAGGSTRPPKVGECRFENGKHIFEMEKPPSGLARILQKWVKDATGLAIKVMVGAESAEDEEEQASAEVEAAAAPAGAASRPGQPAAREPARPSGDAARPAAAESQLGEATLARAPEVWQQTQREIAAGIEQLKSAIRREFAEEGPELAAEIDQKMEKLDGILDNLDAKLSDSLTRAHAATSPAARTNELKKTRTILAGYTNFVNSEPLIAQIDSNPFGVQINLKRRLTETLTHVAQAIGR